MSKIHVVYNKDEDDWIVKAEGKHNPISIWQKQESAIKAGGVIAEELEAELLIYGKFGMLQKRHFYGKGRSLIEERFKPSLEIKIDK